MKKNIHKLILYFSIITLFTLEARSAIFMVTSNADAGAGSLRAALSSADASPGFDTIYFDTPSSIVIPLANTLGAFNVLIDGTSHPLYAGSPVVALDGTAGVGDGIAINGGNGTIIKGLAIYGCQGFGIAIISVNNNIISACTIGLNLSGLPVANSSGILLQNSSTNIIGGTSFNDRNIISGNTNNGVEINGSSNTILSNNFIGLDANGTLGMGNGTHGILIVSSDNTMIGGNTPQERNIISGNGIGTAGVGMGIQISQSTNVSIKGNYIGTSYDGSSAIGNATHGIQAQESPGIIIGGNYYTEGNLIAASKFHGIILDDHSGNSIVKGNIIGTDLSLTMNFKNGGVGIVSKLSDNIIIGDTINDEFNVVGFSGEYGILVANGSNNLIRGNFVGTDITGIKNLGNAMGGVNIRSEDPSIFNNNNEINYNTIAFNGYLFPAGDPNVAQNKGPGIAVAITEWNIGLENENTRFTIMRFNSIYCNAGKGIDLNQNGAGVRRGNQNKVAPRLNDNLSTSQVVVGFTDAAIANDSIDIYLMDNTCSSCDVNPQGKIYLTSIKAGADGSWSYDYGSPIPGRLVATATDLLGNTSEFSICYNPCNLSAVINPLSNAVVNLNNTNSVSLNLSSLGSTAIPAIDSLSYFINYPPSLTWEKYASSDTVITFSHQGKYSSGSYEFSLVIYSNGCRDTANTRLEVEYLFIPNLVTPNGDSFNEKFFISDSPDRYNLSVFNRWGALVYNKDGYMDQWDLSQVSDGVYYYTILDTRESGKEYNGWVHVFGRQY